MGGKSTKTKQSCNEKVGFEAGNEKSEGADVSRGRERFQSWGAYWLNAQLSVALRRAEGTERWLEQEDLRKRREMVTRRRSD